MSTMNVGDLVSIGPDQGQQDPVTLAYSGRQAVVVGNWRLPGGSRVVVRLQEPPSDLEEFVLVKDANLRFVQAGFLLGADLNVHQVAFQEFCDARKADHKLGKVTQETLTVSERSVMKASGGQA